MKKLLFLSLFCTFLFSSTQAQTYWYKYSHSTTENGVKARLPQFTGWYITFTRNKQICYQSDANGNIMTLFGGGTMPTYQYTGRENGMYIYKNTSPNMLFQAEKKLRFFFTTDYSQFGYYGPLDEYFHIFIQADPNQVEVPKNLFE